MTIDAKPTPTDGRYAVTCRYCGTRVMGSAPKGVFALVADAAKALQAHLRFSCEKAPKMPSRWRDRVAAASIHVIE